ncbi:Cof-type HAD-IIB family hydrolase [Anaerorhabdus sp.]|uniref:Cof-type HAD-IIB family hydrolase n=1 Tax=Anaerorhabdus sp. TaxID=1872524 RepID=UPI002FC72F93
MSENQYKLVLSDLDGTLLNENSQLSEETLDTVLKLQQSGIRFSICSGRPYYGCQKFIEQLQLEKYNGFFVGQNGQYIKSFETGEVIEKQKLNQNDFKKICDLAQRSGVITELFYDTHAYILFPKRNILMSLILCSMYSLRSLIHQSKRFKMIFIRELIDLPDIPKICCLGKPASLRKLADELLALQDYDTFLVNAAWLEVVRIGISKGSALYDIEKMADIPVSSMVTFGDGENDLSMLEIAGLSCAMENAMPNPKKVAHCIIDSNRNHGVAKKLKEIFNL